MNWNQAYEQAFTYAADSPNLVYPEEFATDYADVWSGSPEPWTPAEFATDSGWC